jgi:BASS family bile acid:Na+ symporter
MTPPQTALSRARDTVRAYPELLAVLCAAVIGLSVQAPLRWLVDHQGINILLVILVFATAVTITVGDLRSVAAVKQRLTLSLAAGITVLPALAWVVSHIALAGPLRNGVLTIGLAPCEIASVATTTMAGGRAAPASVMLIGSTVLAVAVAAPILALEAGHASVDSVALIVNLTLVVVAPLALGIALRATRNIGENRQRLTGNTATAAVAALVALIASEVDLSTDYLGVAAASVVFTAGAAGLGWLLSQGTDRTIAIPVLLTTSMRDFAIAAGIATAAFGAAAAAPLGLYGIAVIIWGTAVAGVLRRNNPPSSTPAPLVT